MRSPLRSRLALITAATLTVGLSPLVAVGAARAATFEPALDCPAEQFPAAGAARSSASTSYQAPFDAELGMAGSSSGYGDGGYIIVNGSNGPGLTGSSTGGALSVVLGPKGMENVTLPDGTTTTADFTTGTLFGNACGTFGLPSLQGDIPQGDGPTQPDSGNVNYNHNFILHGPEFVSTQDLLANPSEYASVIDSSIPVALEVPGTGVAMIPLSGTGSADGDIANAIASTTGANGGLNVSFDVSAKATATISASELPALGALLPTSGPLSSLLTPLTNAINSGGGECTLVIGDQNLTGYPADHVGPFTTPVHVTTDPTASAAAATDGAAPVTGPIGDASGVAVSTGIIQPPIDPDTTPDVGALGAGTSDPSTLCNPVVAELLNDGFGLPQAGSTQEVPADTFVAPVTFRAYATQ